MPANTIYNSIKLISEIDFGVLEQNYHVFVVANTQLENLLMKNNEYLSSYMVDIEEFEYMINLNPSTSAWRLRFGLDLTQSNWLQIMIVGINDNGDITTPYFQLTKPALFPLPGLIRSEAISNKIAISNEDMQQWFTQYKTDIESNTITKGNFSSPHDSPNILQGYTYFSSDFSDTVKFDTFSNSVVLFSFIIYTNTAPTSHQNMLGVAIGDLSDLSLNFKFYDLSKPCPPTC